jgi:proteic killer suppression protein
MPQASPAVTLARRLSTLQLAFESKELRTFCESESDAKLEFGLPVAEMLKHRLADMRAATSVTDLVAGRPRPLQGTAPQRVVVDLCAGYCIVFAANHTKNPLTKSGEVDWKRVTRIKLLCIGRDHGYHARI